MFAKYIRTAGAVMIAGTIAALTPLSAEAIEFGRYHLESHDDGTLFKKGKSPKYGLRLDKLLGPNGNKDATFNFDHELSNVLLEYKDDNTIRIFGDVYGGQINKKTGKYEGDFGLWTLDMTYDNVVKKEDGSLWVYDEKSDEVKNDISVNGGSGIGKITQKYGKELSFNLGEESKENDDRDPTFSFAIETGHRGESGFSLYGWVTSGDEEKVKSRDFLAKVGDKVSTPEPATLLGLLGVSVIGLVSAKRQKQQDS